MCGIAGIVGKQVKCYEGNLERMIEKLRHRGPDAEGSQFFLNCALGHTRLSIIDLTNGTQPMLSDDGNVAISFNGEIYGYREIQKYLTGYSFRTTSDTEVILALYEKYGASFLNKLPGMFAFALWDNTDEKLICARDRFGEKPLYYAFGSGGEFVFSSEIKGILASGLVTPTLNQKALTHYLNKLYVQPDQTIYKNIYTLPPAHFLSFQKGNLKIGRYWSFPDISPNVQLSEAVEQFQELFYNAVKKQLVADVEVGAFLSGGLDSTSTVMAASSYVSSLRTYSFGFDGDKSELPYAQDVAAHFGTRHLELYDDTPNLAELLLLMQSVYDEPFADSSNIPTFLLCKKAREYGKVVLTGDGADELLGGYDFWYKPLIYMELANNTKTIFPYIPLFLSKMARRIPQEYFQEWSKRLQGKTQLQKFGSINNAHSAQEIFTSSDLINLGIQKVEAQTPLHWEITNTVDDALRTDIERYMPGDILVKTDRASMAHGLELRAPFLDADLASFCISLPTKLKVTTKASKILLREAFSARWPKSIRTRSKQGFGAPVTEWLERSNLKELKKEYLENPQRKIFEMVSFDGALPFIEENSYKTWSLLVLSLWSEQHSFEMSN